MSNYQGNWSVIKKPTNRLTDGTDTIGPSALRAEVRKRDRAYHYFEKSFPSVSSSVIDN